MLSPRARSAAPAAALFLGVALAVAPFALLADGLTIWPDELLYVKQAQHIWSEVAPVRSGQPFFSSYSELLPLVTAPILGPLGTTAGLAVVHVLFGFALASISIPVYLLSRRIGLDERGALAAAALGTVTTALSFAGTMMTEVLAYPLFAWFLLAVHATMREPSRRRDLGVTLAFCLLVAARAQLVVLGVAVPLAIVLDAALAGRSWRRELLRHRTLVVVGVLGALLLAVIAAASQGSGGYSNLIGQVDLNSGIVRSGIDNLSFIVLVTGGAPAALTAAWIGARLHEGRAADPGERAFASLALFSLVLLVVQVGVFGASHLAGTFTITGRYLLYLAVPFSIGTVCAVRRPVGGRALLAAAAGVAVIVMATRAPAISAAIDAPSVDDRGALGAGVGDVLAPGPLRLVLMLMALATVGLTWLVLRRLPARALALVAIPLLVLGAGTTAFRMRAIVRQADEREVLLGARDWIDRAADGEPVDVLPAPLGPGADEELRWRNTMFYNRDVRRSLNSPGAPVWSTLQYSETTALEVERQRFITAKGPVSPLLAISDREVRFGFAGTVVARQEGIRLIRSGDPGRLDWAFVGLDSFGARQVGVPAPQLYLFGAGRSRRVRLTLAGDGTARCPCPVRAVGRRVDVGTGAPRTVTLDPAGDQVTRPSRQSTRLSVDLPRGVRVSSIRLEPPAR